MMKNNNRRNYVSNLSQIVMDMEEGKAKYDQTMKELLADSQVLAWILKRFVPEYKDCELEDIEKKYIQPETIMVSKMGVEQGSESIQGIRNEDTVQGEATVFYDVLFHVWYPKMEGKQIGMYLNLEAQSDYYPGYPIEPRGIYYASRRLTAQLKKVDKDTNYGTLQKVYSIWLCMGNVPVYEENTVSLYSLNKNDIIGKVKRNEEIYDLISVIIMRYNDKTELKDQTLQMLQTLSSDRLSKKEKLKRLKNLGMRVDDRIEEGVEEMCNMGDYIEAKAIKKGIEQGIERGMIIGKEREVGILRTQLEKKKRTPKETAELLELPLGYIQSIADMLQKDAGASDLQIAERLMNIRI